MAQYNTAASIPVSPTFVLKKYNMEKKSLIQQITANKKAKGITYADLAKLIGASEVWTVHALLRQATLSQSDAEKIHCCPVKIRIREKRLF